MYKTAMRAAFENATGTMPLVQKALVTRVGTRAPRFVRKARVQQIWSSGRAAAEFLS